MITKKVDYPKSTVAEMSVYEKNGKLATKITI